MDIRQLTLTQVEVELNACGIGCERVHPGATLLIYDTFGSYRRPIVQFCAYLNKSVGNDPQAVIDPPKVEKALQELKEGASQRTEESMGHDLAGSLAGGEGGGLLTVIKSMLPESEGDEQRHITKSRLKKMDLWGNDPDDVWQQICSRRDLFFLDNHNGEVCATLRVKWWKFSTWWRKSSLA